MQQGDLNGNKTMDVQTVVETRLVWKERSKSMGIIMTTTIAYTALNRIVHAEYKCITIDLDGRGRIRCKSKRESLNLGNCDRVRSFSPCQGGQTKEVPDIHAGWNKMFFAEQLHFPNFICTSDDTHLKTTIVGISTPDNSHHQLFVRIVQTGKKKVDSIPVLNIQL